MEVLEDEIGEPAAALVPGRAALAADVGGSGPQGGEPEAGYCLPRGRVGEFGIRKQAAEQDHGLTPHAANSWRRRRWARKPVTWPAALMSAEFSAGLPGSRWRGLQQRCWEQR